MTTDQHQAFRVPVEERDCDALLATAESRLQHVSEDVRQEMAADLARFLGAFSRVWTAERRSRLAAILASSGRVAIAPILRTVVVTPREEVVDDAVAVLAAMIERDESAAASIVTALGQGGSAPEPPIVREVLLRALVRACSARAREAKLRAAYLMAKGDPSAAVRDCAVQSLSIIGRHDGAKIVLELLVGLRKDERDGAVLESIDDAVEAVRGH